MGNQVSLCSGARLHELEEKVVEQERTIATLRRSSVADMGQKESEIAQLRAQLDGLRSQLEQTRAEGEAKTAAEVAEREGRIRDLSGQMESLQSRLDEALVAREENERRKVEIAERDRRIAELNEQTHRLREAMLAEQADERARSAQETEERERRIQDLSRQLESVTGDVDRLLSEQAEAERVRRQYEQTQARVAELEPRVQTLSTLLQQRETELGEAKRSVEDRQSELQQLSQKIGSLQASLTEAEHTKSALTLTKSQMEELQIELEAKRRIEADLRSLQTKMQEQQALLQQERRKSVQLEAKMQMEMLRRHRCFGLPIKDYSTEDVQGYASPIPAVLVRLRQYLVDHGGLEKEGIFRLAPNQKDLEKAKDALNRGQFEGTDDVSTAANLIGCWFRELPTPVLADLKSSKVVKVTKPKEAWKLVSSSVEEPALSVFSWLVDLGVLVSSHADKNRMSAKNLAIVFAPNVFTMPDVTAEADSHKAEQIMNEIKQFSVFVELCIQYRRDSVQSGSLH